MQQTTLNFTQLLDGCCKDDDERAYTQRADNDTNALLLPSRRSSSVQQEKQQATIAAARGNVKQKEKFSKRKLRKLAQLKRKHESAQKREKVLEELQQYRLDHSFVFGEESKSRRGREGSRYRAEQQQQNLQQLLLHHLPSQQQSVQQSHQPIAQSRQSVQQSQQSVQQSQQSVQQSQQSVQQSQLSVHQSQLSVQQSQLSVHQSQQSVHQSQQSVQHKPQQPVPQPQQPLEQSQQPKEQCQQLLQVQLQLQQAIKEQQQQQQEGKKAAAVVSSASIADGGSVKVAVGCGMGASTGAGSSRSQINATNAASSGGCLVPLRKKKRLRMEAVQRRKEQLLIKLEREQLQGTDPQQFFKEQPAQLQLLQGTEQQQQQLPQGCSLNHQKHLKKKRGRKKVRTQASSCASGVVGQQQQQSQQLHQRHHDSSQGELEGASEEYKEASSHKLQGTSTCATRSSSSIFSGTSRSRSSTSGDGSSDTGGSVAIGTKTALSSKVPPTQGQTSSSLASAAAAISAAPSAEKASTGESAEGLAVTATLSSSAAAKEVVDSAVSEEVKAAPLFVAAAVGQSRAQAAVEAAAALVPSTKDETPLGQMCCFAREAAATAAPEVGAARDVEGEKQPGESKTRHGVKRSLAYDSVRATAEISRSPAIERERLLLPAAEVEGRVVAFCAQQEHPRMKDIDDGEISDVSAGNCTSSADEAPLASARALATQDINANGARKSRWRSKRKRAADAVQDAKQRAVVAAAAAARRRKRREQLMCRRRHADVLCVCGETGSGKSTQIPQFLFEAGVCYPVVNDGLEKFEKQQEQPKKETSLASLRIGITQPRRVAAIAVAKRLSEELGNQDLVGYQIRYKKENTGEKCRIKCMTDGVLLREIQNDFLCSQYACLIVDEAHERSVNTDLLLGLLSRIVMLRRTRFEKGISSIPPLKVVIMSASLCLKDFTENEKLFCPPPAVLSLPGKQYTVNSFFAKQTPSDYVEAAIRKTIQAHVKLPAGSILVFLTGREEVEYAAEALRHWDQRRRKRPCACSHNNNTCSHSPNSQGLSSSCSHHPNNQGLSSCYSLHSNSQSLSSCCSHNSNSQSLSSYCSLHSSSEGLSSSSHKPNCQSLSSCCSHNLSSQGSQSLSSWKGRVESSIDKESWTTHQQEPELVEQGRQRLEIEEDPLFQKQLEQEQQDSVVAVIAAGAVEEEVVAVDDFVLPSSEEDDEGSRWPDEKKITGDDDSDAEEEAAAAFEKQQRQQGSSTRSCLWRSSSCNKCNFSNARQSGFFSAAFVSLSFWRDPEEQEDTADDDCDDHLETKAARRALEWKTGCFSTDQKASQIRSQKNDDSAVAATAMTAAPLAAKVTTETELAGDCSSEMSNGRENQAAADSSQVPPGTNSLASGNRSSSSISNLRQQQLDLDNGDLSSSKTAALLADEEDSAATSEKEELCAAALAARLHSSKQRGGHERWRGAGADTNTRSSRQTTRSETTFVEKQRQQHLMDGIEATAAPALENPAVSEKEVAKGVALPSAEARLRVIPLYAALSSKQQMQAFRLPKDNERIVIIATNVAETSITLPNVRYVIDSGREKRRVYAAEEGSSSSVGGSSFTISFISQASAQQRAGRAGRLGPGFCYRLYSSSVFQHVFEKDTPAAITRTPLDPLLLYMAQLGIPRLSAFPFPAPVPTHAVAAARARLLALGALEDQQQQRGSRAATISAGRSSFSHRQFDGDRCTVLGLRLAQLPIHPRYGKMLLFALLHSRRVGVECLELCCFLAAALSIGELIASHVARLRSSSISNRSAEVVAAFSSLKQQDQSLLQPIGKDGVTDQTSAYPYKKFDNDIDAYLWICGAYAHAKKKEIFCTRFGLHAKRMQEVYLLANQLAAQLLPDLERQQQQRQQQRESSPQQQSQQLLHVPLKPQPPSNLVRLALHACVLEGLVDHVAVWRDGDTRISSSSFSKSSGQTTCGGGPLHGEVPAAHYDGYYCAEMKGAAAAIAAGSNSAEQPLAWIHASSNVAVCRPRPALIVYNHLLSSSGGRPFLRECLQIDVTALRACSSPLIQKGNYLDIPAPVYDPGRDCVVGWQRAVYTPLSLSLPATEEPLPEHHPLYYPSIACAFLAGQIVSALKPMRTDLLVPPEAALAGFRAVVYAVKELVAAFKEKKVKSRRDLLSVWQKDKYFLLAEYIHLQRHADYDRIQQLREMWPPIKGDS